MTDPTIRDERLAAATGAEWSSKLAFVLAAAGSAVGLGNVWKFPYLAGENGGGAFVLVYLGCVVLIGLPILVAEILIGRRGNRSPIQSIARLAREANAPTAWSVIGWIGTICSFLILSFYSVVAGWSLAYLGYGLSGLFAVEHADTAQAMSGQFDALQANPALLIACHTVILAATVFIVANGIRRGLERATKLMMPGLFVILVALVIYAMAFSGAFQAGVKFLLQPNFEALSWDAVLVALGQAFFTLSLGMTAMMAYGAHLNKNASIGNAAVHIALLDTGVALLAGLAIFPIVFANALEPSAGPGLIFVTLPIAFAEVTGGSIAGVAFFLFLTMAALTSSISILEPAVQYIEQRFVLRRRSATLLVGIPVWFIGAAVALSFNLWRQYTLADKNLFDLLDYVTANIMLPLGGLLIALFAGWVMHKRVTCEELQMRSPRAFALWRFALRFVAPVGVLVVFVYNLI